MSKKARPVGCTGSKRGLRGDGSGAVCARSYAVLPAGVSAYGRRKLYPLMEQAQQDIGGELLFELLPDVEARVLDHIGALRAVEEMRSIKAMQTVERSERVPPGMAESVGPEAVDAPDPTTVVTRVVDDVGRQERSFPSAVPQRQRTCLHHGISGNR